MILHSLNAPGKIHYSVTHTVHRKLLGISGWGIFNYDYLDTL